MDKIALLLVLYKDVKHLSRLIQSLEQQTANYEIFAIDCHEDQESISYLKQERPDSDVYSFQGNLGYAAGNNFLAQKAIDKGYKYLMICNTDVIFSRNTLEILYNSLVFTDYIISAPLIYNGTPECIKGLHSYAERMDFNKMKVIVENSINADINNLPETQEVNIVTGCTFLIKSSFVVEHGLFYTEGFMYGEETDLACRMNSFNNKAICVKSAVAWHNHDFANRTINSLSFAYYYMNRNFVLLCKRYDKKSVIYKYLFMELINIPRKLIWTIRKYNIKLFYYYYLGIIDGLRNVKGVNKTL